MNQWQKSKVRSGWLHNGLAEWIESNTAFLSVVFSWNLQEAYQRAIWYRSQGYFVRAGGPAVDLHPDVMAGIAITSLPTNALPHHNPDATFTSRGCIRHCPFCLVPQIEGDLVELDDWKPKRIVCDNNLLACSKAHFDQVIDRLKRTQDIDFNQGLDARLLTKYHADRLTELELHCIRLAWDDTRMERRFMIAFEMLLAAGIPAHMIRAYVLIGFNDTPEDALYRLETIYGLGAWPNPMRYQPLDAQRRNEYVAPGWTDQELKRYMRYWQNLRYLGGIPFDEFRNRGNKSAMISKQQMALPF